MEEEIFDIVLHKDADEQVRAQPSGRRYVKVKKPLPLPAASQRIITSFFKPIEIEDRTSSLSAQVNIKTFLKPAPQSVSTIPQTPKKTGKRGRSSKLIVKSGSKKVRW